MIVANPIYDVIFKYLLDDTEIARELLSTILGEEIISIEIKPQETTTENESGTINILRFDFKAVIKTKTGEIKKVLIELQKAKKSFDVMRFRRYLGDNYRKEDNILDGNGEMEIRVLPIVSIYLLGFPLDNIKNAVVKVNREYRDVTTQEILDVKEDFVELLTHDSYMIQLKLLAGKTRTKLERVLQVFSPEFKTEDPQKLDFTGDADDPLIKKMLVRLNRALASEDMRRMMDAEDEIERTFARELGKKDKIIALQNIELEVERQKIEAKDQALESKDQALEAKDQALESKDQALEALMKELEELKKQIKKTI